MIRLKSLVVTLVPLPETLALGSDWSNASSLAPSGVSTVTDTSIARKEYGK
ncbi:hypothetical protein EMGBD4_07930 [Verrucomicrobiota bacterium]|nr:hypothetical protein EMGBD4_07930 [Verrucomicrobiota bacterium]